MRRFSWVAALLLATCLLGSDAWAQRRITGRVTAAGTDEPLVNASVIISGTSSGALTGERGTYALVVPAGEVQLSVRQIGYRRRSVTVRASDAEVNVSLDRDPFRLEAQNNSTDWDEPRPEQLLRTYRNARTQGIQLHTMAVPPGRAA